jgi:hypothetical protein
MPDREIKQETLMTRIIGGVKGRIFHSHTDGRRYKVQDINFSDVEGSPNLELTCIYVDERGDELRSKPFRLPIWGQLQDNETEHYGDINEVMRSQGPMQVPSAYHREWAKKP